MAYEQILLAVDLSPVSEQVAEKAYAIAHAANANLSVIHVMEHSPVAYGGEFSIPIDVDLEHTLEQRAREQLAEIGERYNILKEHQYLKSGSVKLAVTDLAEAISADLLVVGTHGHQGLDILLGSRANAILHRAGCDVWVVKVADE